MLRLFTYAALVAAIILAAELIVPGSASIALVVLLLVAIAWQVLYAIISVQVSGELHFDVRWLRPLLPYLYPLLTFARRVGIAAARLLQYRSAAAIISIAAIIYCVVVAARQFETGALYISFPLCVIFFAGVVGFRITISREIF